VGHRRPSAAVLAPRAAKHRIWPKRRPGAVVRPRATTTAPPLTLPSRLRAPPLPANSKLTKPGKPGFVWGGGHTGCAVRSCTQYNENESGKCGFGLADNYLRADLLRWHSRVSVNPQGSRSHRQVGQAPIAA